MDERLEVLYPQYLAFMRDMATDSAAVLAPLPSGIGSLPPLEPLTQVRFQKMWASLKENSQLKQRWMRRLELGYAAEKARVGEVLRSLRHEAPQSESTETDKVAA